MLREASSPWRFVVRPLRGVSSVPRNRNPRKEEEERRGRGGLGGRLTLRHSLAAANTRCVPPSCVWRLVLSVSSERGRSCGRCARGRLGRLRKQGRVTRTAVSGPSQPCRVG